jgi:aspartate aminotransferase
MRVGWCAAPPAVTAPMRDVLGHVGAWAPKAEQVATAAFLDAPDELRAFQEGFRTEVKARLDLLHAGFAELAADGYPVEAIEPQGAIYLAVRFDLFGKGLRTNEEIRRRLLEAGVAVVPFQAFGLREDTGWFRLSVGAVSLDEIRSIFPRLREVL